MAEMEPLRTDRELAEPNLGPATEPVSAGSRRTRVRNSLLGAAIVLLMGTLLAASRYQPLSIRPSFASSGPVSSSEEVKMSLETNLSNAGLLGVSVLALRPIVDADPPVDVHPLMPCIHVQGRMKECAQDSHGLLIGNAFRPFALSGGDTLPVAWQYSFSCHPRPDGSFVSGPVEVAVTYRFGWFTHTVVLVLSDTVTSGGSACRVSQG